MIATGAFRVACKKCLAFPRKLHFCGSICSQGDERRCDEVKMDETMTYSIISRQLAPPLASGRHKGQAGRIGVFGGCLEYTGAPYFAAISALKVGADLAHVFCTKDAAPVIKSYSPELIVHPYLDDSNAMKKIEPWLDRLHVILIGPGLGRDQSTFNVIGKLLDVCRAKKKPLVIDADGLFYLSQNSKFIKDYPEAVVLTPNSVEFARLIGASDMNINRDNFKTSVLDLGRNITVLKKGHDDEIMDVTKSFKVSGGGSGRRCGGQGDLLAGSLSTFLCWALQHTVDVNDDHDDRPMIACYAACRLTRECNARAFAKKGRSMVCSDMIEEIGKVFRDHFENK